MSISFPIVPRRQKSTAEEVEQLSGRFGTGRERRMHRSVAPLDGGGLEERREFRLPQTQPRDGEGEECAQAFLEPA